MRFALSHLLPFGAFHGRHGGARHAHRVRFATNRGAHEPAPRAVGSTADPPRPSSDVTEGPLFGRPAARWQLAASTALAAWHGGQAASGWWRHSDGGYGWVGPLFWPFAYDDIADYTVRGEGTSFWNYGYGDIYAAMFAPYGSDDLARYVAPLRGRKQDRPLSLAQMCGDEKSENAAVPVDQIKQSIQPNDEQRAVLDDLAKASIQAAQTIRLACPAHEALTASDRLAAMQRRLEAMISAIATMRAPLEKLYELLDDEQKGRLDAIAESRRRPDPATATSSAQSCSNSGSAAFEWPSREIEARLHLNEAQRAELEVLQHMSAKADRILKNDCRPDNGLSPPDRLAAADIRLDAMLQALKLVRPALEDFYATLSDEQKAQFEAIGPSKAS